MPSLRTGLALATVALICVHGAWAGSEIEHEFGAPLPSIYCRHSTGWQSSKQIGDLSTSAIAALRARSEGCTVEKEEASRVVDDMLSQVVDNYVYPTVARAMREQVMGAMESGAIFSDGNGCFSFVEKVLAELFAACHDRHLSVCYQYDPESSQSPVGLRAHPRPWTNPIAAATDDFSAESGIANVTVIESARTIGYIKLTHFPALDDKQKRAYQTAMEAIHSTDGLIIDARVNMGGNPDAVRHLIGYLLPPRTHVINTYYRVPGHFNYTTTEGVAGPVPGERYGSHKPVLVLATEKTASAGEELCYDLQLQKRAKIVGTPTWGGAHPVMPFRSLGRFSINIPNGSSHDPETMDNWEVVGVIPDVTASAESALDVALSMLNGA